MTNSKTILITGGTGALGAALTRHFSRKGHRVIAQGRAIKPPDNFTNFAEYVSFDLQRNFTLPECDIMIHTAALSDDKAKLSDLIATNVYGTERLLEKMAVSTKLIHISSSSVYLPSELPIKEEEGGKETSKLKLSPYGLSKWKTEQLIHEKSKIEDVTILRPRAFYGAGDYVILPRILKLVKDHKGEPFIQRPGKMEVSVSLTHYSTIAHAIECALNVEKEGIQTYNIADNEEYQLIKIVRELTTGLYGHPLTEKEVPIAFLKFLSWFKINGITKLLVRSFTNNMTLNIDKAINELNFRPEMTFQKQLPELINWIENNGGVEMLKKGSQSLAWTKDL